MRLNRAGLTWAMLMCAVLISPANAREGQITTATMTHIHGSVYLLRDDPINVLASIGDDGILFVDALLAKAPTEVISTVRQNYNKPLRYTITTHCDKRAINNSLSAGDSATSIAHSQVKTRANSIPPSCAKALEPTITFEQELTLQFNGENVQILKVPSNGYSDSDAIVYFSASNVVHVGNLFSSPYVGFVDPAAGGTLYGLIDDLEFIIELLPEDVTVVPDHGIPATYADLQHGLAFLRAVAGVVDRGIQSGTPLAVIKQSTLLHEWQNTPGMGLTVADYVEQFYSERQSSHPEHREGE